MDKEKVFEKLDAAKESQKEIWIGILGPSKITKEYKEIFRIKYDYKYEHGSLSVIPIGSKTKILIEISTILDFEESSSEQLTVIINEERA
ncbi:hypothetical protein K4R20_01290 [Staphylococcus epidermidis]|nr:hypothetical protein [Staphylococcus epidermidis]MCG2015949.1 hypothetical protein [Staphylococcus epidermidis]MCG2027084.1 hypothetical protein [Staphylococcus epidermidis]MCG2275396.1 hypothetical protein [Staphylococcus epidermidis]